MNYSMMKSEYLTRETRRDCPRCDDSTLFLALKYELDKRGLPHCKYKFECPETNCEFDSSPVFKGRWVEDGNPESDETKEKAIELACEDARNRGMIDYESSEQYTF